MQLGHKNAARTLENPHRHQHLSTAITCSINSDVSRRRSPGLSVWLRRVTRVRTSGPAPGMRSRRMLGSLGSHWMRPAKSGSGAPPPPPPLLLPLLLLPLLLLVVAVLPPGLLLPPGLPPP